MSQLPPSRLLWQCRRGMLELDALLQAFVCDAYRHLDESERRAFERLLRQADVDLYDWLAGRGEPPADLSAVVESLRACRVGPHREVFGPEVRRECPGRSAPGVVSA